MTRVLLALGTGAVAGVGIVALAGYLVLFHGPDLDGHLFNF
ncbi:hypothetical protein [Mycolicibacterium conceptionense]|nr:hypothetical protein [Mycolicibacterium conceptionense]